MHPAIIRQLAADRISQIHAQAEDDRLARRARRARRRAASTRPGLPASGMLSNDVPGPRPAADHPRAAQRTATTGGGRLAAR